MRKNTVLENIVEPVVSGMGYEFVGLEYLPQGKHSILRIFIDTSEGVSLEDCSLVSQQVSAVLDVEDPIKGEYNLEVSSPGLDRPLFTIEQFERFKGYQCHLRSRTPIDGQRKFTGKISVIEDQTIVLELQEKAVKVPFDLIEKANLIPEF